MRKYKKKTSRYILLAIFILLIVGIILLIKNPFKKSEIIRGEALGIIEIPKDSIEIGSIAPNFILKDSHGNLLKLSEFRGKKGVVINFWASWCPFCLEEMPDFQQMADKYNDSIVILGINRGEKESVAVDYAEHKLPLTITYPILLDSNEDVSNVYIRRGMPVTYFIDKNGIITNRYFGKITKEIMEQEIEKLR